MRNLWKNRYVVYNQAGDASGGGSGGGGASSIINAPNGGGGSAPAQGNPNPAPGATGGNPPPGNPNPGTTPPGQNSQDWRSQLPPELQDNASLKKYGSVPALAAAYVNAQKLIGADKLPKPGPHTSEEQWREIFEGLGVPKEVKDYQVKFKEGVSLDQKFSDDFKANAHKFGILPKQAQQLADWFSDVNLNSEKAVQQQIAERQKANIDGLKAEWGAAFDQKAARINKLLADNGGQDVMNHFNKLGLGSDPQVLKLLAGLADKMYSEDEVVGEDGGTPAMTPAEARTEALKITGDKTHPYWIKDHPAHKEAVKQVQGLWEMASAKPKSS